MADKSREIGLLREKGGEGNLTLVYSSRDEAHNAAAALKLYLEGKTGGQFKVQSSKFKVKTSAKTNFVILSEAKDLVFP